MERKILNRMRAILRWSFPVFALLTAGILFFRPEWLDLPVLGKPGIPLGNVLFWLLNILLPASGLALQPPGKGGHSTWVWTMIRLLFALNLLQGLAWGFAGKSFSGNWAFNFVNDPVWSRIWTYYLFFSPFMGLLAWVIAGTVYLQHFFGKRRED